jgi:peptidoglycan/LPS O-acetylase OafA/YrhL
MPWGWSLCLEEQFYLTVPFLFLALQRLKSVRMRIALLSALTLSALVVRLTIFLRHPTWTDVQFCGVLYFRTHTRFDTLVAGILLAVVHQNYGKEIARWLESPFHRALLGVPALGCLWLLLFPTMFGQDHLAIVHVFIWGTVTSLMYLLTVPMALYGQGMVCQWLSMHLFRRIATLGYGIYLVHIPIIEYIMVPLARRAQERHVSMLYVWPAALVATSIFSVAVAYVLHIAVEKPSLRLRDRFAR